MIGNHLVCNNGVEKYFYIVVTNCSSLLGEVSWEQTEKMHEYRPINSIFISDKPYNPHSVSLIAIDSNKGEREGRETQLES